MLSETNHLQDCFDDVRQTEDIVKVLQGEQDHRVRHCEFNDCEDDVDDDHSKHGPLEDKMVDKFVEVEATVHLWARRESGLPLHQLYDP